MKIKLSLATFFATIISFFILSCSNSIEGDLMLEPSSLVMSSVLQSETNSSGSVSQEDQDNYNALINEMYSSFENTYQEQASQLNREQFLSFVIQNEGFTNVNQIGENLIHTYYDKMKGEVNNDEFQLANAEYIMAVGSGVENLNQLELSISNFWGTDYTAQTTAKCKWYQLGCHIKWLFGTKEGQDTVKTFVTLESAAVAVYNALK